MPFGALDSKCIRSSKGIWGSQVMSVRLKFPRRVWWYMLVIWVTNESKAGKLKVKGYWVSEGVQGHPGKFRKTCFNLTIKIKMGLWSVTECSMRWMSSFRWVIPDIRISRVIPKTIGMQNISWAEAMESLFHCVGSRVQEIVRIGHSWEFHECIWVHLCRYFSINNFQIPISGEKVAKFLCGRNPQVYLLWFSQWFNFSPWQLCI